MATEASKEDVVAAFDETLAEIDAGDVEKKKDGVIKVSLLHCCCVALFLLCCCYIMVVLKKARDQLQADWVKFVNCNRDGVMLEEDYKKVIADAAAVITQVLTSEYENWICRIAHGCGGTKVRNAAKAMMKYHSDFIGADGREKMPRDPAEHLHPVMWRTAQAMLSAANSASSSSDGADRKKKAPAVAEEGGELKKVRKARR